MFKKMLLVLIIMILTGYAWADPTITMEKAQNLSKSELSKLNAVSKNPNKFGWFDIFAEIESKKIKLGRKFLCIESMGSNMMTAHARHRFNLKDINQDGIDDYIFEFFTSGRGKFYAYVVDGKSLKIIFSSDWDISTLESDYCRFEFVDCKIINNKKKFLEDKAIITTLYLWDSQKRKFVKKI